MLRQLFGEPRREDSGLLLEVNRSIDKYMSILRQQRNQMPDRKFKRLYIWSQGFVRALDELEQSVYCSAKFAERVTKAYAEEMNEQEKDDYHRHVYYYKNAFIRLFSILDKLGHFLNELYELKADRVKSRFSYFTVLRVMHQRHVGKELEQQLYNLKMEYKEPLDRLRNQRNMEIHTINADLLDDLLKAMESKQSNERIPIEDVEANMTDLQQTYEMTCKAVLKVVSHISH
jgi:hypothetical protein